MGDTGFSASHRAVGPAVAVEPGGRAVGAVVRFASRELILWASLYGLYLVVRGATVGSSRDALANAEALIDIEQKRGMFHELESRFG